MNKNKEIYERLKRELLFSSSRDDTPYIDENGYIVIPLKEQKKIQERMRLMYPYYKLRRTEEDKEFFFNNIGFFNIWDEYLILHTTKMKNYYNCIVNRNGKKFSMPKLNDEVETEAARVMNNSFKERKPEEMYEDFFELKNIECISYE